jgi:uncharacterized protein (DUF1697 family)
LATWIALFRGINVGGHRPLPMKDLTALFEGAGYTDVRTYIQSGNVVFRTVKAASSQALAARITGLVTAARGFEPFVSVLSLRELSAAVTANPFPQADADPKSLHLFFLTAAPRSADIEALHALKVGQESFKLKGKVFYLYTPGGFGKSRLAAAVERLLSVEATARNWRTANRLLEMAHSA